MEEEMILNMRRQRRLGVKRLRNELRRLHDLALSPATIHRVLVRHEVMRRWCADVGDTSRSATANRFRAIEYRWIRY